MSKYTKVTILLGAVLSCAVLLWGLQSTVNAADVPDASKTIDYIKNLKPEVCFPHAKHKDNVAGKCQLCHANADATGGIKAELKVKPADMAAAMQHPFHKEVCTNCHKATAQGPTTCAACHAGSCK